MEIMKFGKAMFTYLHLLKKYIYEQNDRDEQEWTRSDSVSEMNLCETTQIPQNDITVN
jgi:hypothetical protein